MWFNVYDYPKFIAVSCLSRTWQDDFTDAGFKTYWFDSNASLRCHWLDDEEYSFFVLRYS